jgi:hypothetical protein
VRGPRHGGPKKGSICGFLSLLEGSGGVGVGYLGDLEGSFDALEGLEGWFE